MASEGRGRLINTVLVSIASLWKGTTTRDASGTLRAWARLFYFGDPDNTSPGCLHFGEARASSLAFGAASRPALLFGTASASLCALGQATRPGLVFGTSRASECLIGPVEVC
jgi:hypothetical protein